MSEKPMLTTESGAPVTDNQNSQTAGSGGPTLL
jgi:catalase